MEASGGKEPPKEVREKTEVLHTRSANFDTSLGKGILGREGCTEKLEKGGRFGYG